MEGEFFGFQMPTDGGSGDSGEGEWIQVTAQRSSQSPRPEHKLNFPVQLPRSPRACWEAVKKQSVALDAIGNEGFHSNHRRSGRYEGYSQDGQYKRYGRYGRTVDACASLNVALN